MASRMVAHADGGEAVTAVVVESKREIVAQEGTGLEVGRSAPAYRCAMLTPPLTMRSSSQSRRIQAWW